MKTIDWYFDFISPFAYLASESLQRFPGDVEIRPLPILFAGLLKHHDTRGPAEIEPMRRFTFRHIRWLADRHGIPLVPPPAHPFNPLKLLRLAIALEADLVTVQHLFQFVWAEGHSSDDETAWQSLLEDLGAGDIAAEIGSETVKNRLRENTEAAIESGIFGVPAFVVDGQVFWGFDSIDFVRDFLANPTLFDSAAMQAIETMPVAVRRKP